MMGMVLLAAESAGLSNWDRSLVAGLASALAAVVTWAVRMLFPLLQQMVENQTRITNNNESFANSQAVLTWMLRGYFEKYGRSKTTILIIEDNPTDAAMIGVVCQRLARKYSLKLLDVPNLTNSYDNIPEAKVVVLDVMLPDATDAILAEFIHHCPCPVIVYSGHEHSRDKFPEAASIIMKGNSKLLERELESIITGARSDSSEIEHSAVVAVDNKQRSSRV